jgi:hypothetical protein
VAVGVGRRVRGAVPRGEGEGLEPRGAGLGEARQQHVRGPRREAGAQGGDARRQRDLGKPEAVELAERERRAPGLQGQRLQRRSHLLLCGRGRRSRRRRCCALLLRGGVLLLVRRPGIHRVRAVCRVRASVSSFLLTCYGLPVTCCRRSQKSWT